jgi:hypothetical protein
MTDTENTAAPRAKKSVALSGTVAGNTAICTVGRTGNDLHYRGYDILDFADEAEFEEIAHLLIHGSLPTGPSWRPTRSACAHCGACPRRCGGVGADPGLGAPDGRDAHRGLDARHAGAGEGGHERGRRPRDRRPAGGLPRLGCSTGTTMRTTGGASKSQTDDDSVGGHFLRLMHGQEPSATAGAGDAHLADPVRGTRVQRFHLRRAGGRRHQLGHLLGDHRRDRRTARTRSTAARTRRPARSSCATGTRTRPRRTSANGSNARRSSSASATPCTRSATRATR